MLTTDMTEMIDEIVVSAKDIFREMTLLELLAEGNLVAKMWHSKNLDPLQNKLVEILRCETEIKLQ